MGQRRKSGQPHPHDRTIDPRLAQKVEWDQDTVVQLRVPLAQGSSFQARIPGPAYDLLAQRSVIPRFNPHLGRTKGRHIAHRTAAGGNLEIVPVQNGVRRGHNEHIRIPAGHLRRRSTHSLAGGGDFTFPSLPHFRQQHRRMRGQDST